MDRWRCSLSLSLKESTFLAAGSVKKALSPRQNKKRNSTQCLFSLKLQTNICCQSGSKSVVSLCSISYSSSSVDRVGRLPPAQIPPPEVQRDGRGIVFRVDGVFSPPHYRLALTMLMSADDAKGSRNTCLWSFITCFQTDISCIFLSLCHNVAQKQFSYRGDWQRRCVEGSKVNGTT